MMDTSKFKKRNIRTLNQSLRILSTFAQWCCANSDMKENPFLGSVERNVEKNEDIKGLLMQRLQKFLTQRSSWTQQYTEKDTNQTDWGITSSHSFYVLLVQEWVKFANCILKISICMRETRREKICGWWISIQMNVFAHNLLLM